MKIAFATKDNVFVNDHFGWCEAFAVYNVSPEGFNFLGLRDVPEGKDELDKINGRISAISDCTIVCCADIGPVAAARVVRARIYPMKTAPEEPVESVLKKITETLKSPPLWLKKVLEAEK